LVAMISNHNLRSYSEFAFVANSLRAYMLTPHRRG
jgi:hypothetical protein